MSYYQRDSLSIKSNKIIANLFAQLILLSENVQSFRQIIASVPYYDCVQLFRVLDKDQKGYLTLKDFAYLIGQSHKKLATYAFSWFDQSKLGEISRLQFISFLMPRRNQQLRQMVARRIQQPVNDQNFSQTINQQLRIFTELLNSMISHQLKIIQQRKSLLKQPDYSLKGVLNSFDLNNHEFVSTKDILKFLKNYAIQASKQQLQDLLQIMDSKLEGKINLQQLKWLIQGLQNNSKEYKDKVRKSSVKKRQKSIRRDQKQQPVKQFVRTPLRSKQQNNAPKSIQQSKVSQNNQSKLYQSGVKYNQQRQYPQTAQAKRHQSIVRKDELNNLSNIQNLNNFQAILRKCRQAESQLLRKDADLIRAEQQMRQKLQNQFYQKSNQRRRATTQSHSVTSQSTRRPVQQFYTKDYLRPHYFKQQYQKPSQSKRQTSKLNQQIIKSVHDRYPYTSQYDRKINTIVDNFYKRNNDDSTPLHSSVKRYGTYSNSFNITDRDYLVNRSYERSYDRHVQPRRTFLEEQLYKQKTKVRPFDHGSTLIKEQINKKLGDDIFNIKLSKPYNPLAHQIRQKPLEQSIKRLKQSNLRNQQKKKDSLNGMMQNISIISKQSQKKDNSANSNSKPSEDRYYNLLTTEIKPKSIGQPSSYRYQTVYNSQSTKSRGLRTTQTKFPYAQSENKLTPSLIKIQEQRNV